MRVKLEDVCERGISNLRQSDIEEKTGLYPIYGAAGYIGNVDFYHQSAPYIAVVKDGAGIGRAMLLPAKSSVIGTMQYLLPKDRVLPEYLYYVVRYMHLEKYFSGATIPHIYFRDYKNEEFNLDSLEEQSRIVGILGRIERIIGAHQHKLNALDTLIKARFVEMFGDPVSNPKGWKKDALKEHADVLVGYPFSSEGYTEQGIKIVGGYNIMQGYVQWAESKHWPAEQGYEQYLLQVNDIVMAMDRPWVNGGLKISRIESSYLPALLIQRTACIRSKDVEQEFLYSLLDSQWFAEHCNVTGSLVPHISNKDINSFQIIIPPLEMQKAFVSIVTQVDKSKVVVQKALDEAQLLFDSLMQMYFG